MDFDEGVQLGSTALLNSLGGGRSRVLRATPATVVSKVVATSFQPEPDFPRGTFGSSSFLSSLTSADM